MRELFALSRKPRRHPTPGLGFCGFSCSWLSAASSACMASSSPALHGTHAKQAQSGKPCPESDSCIMTKVLLFKFCQHAVAIHGGSSRGFAATAAAYLASEYVVMVVANLPACMATCSDEDGTRQSRLRTSRLLTVLPGGRFRFLLLGGSAGLHAPLPLPDAAGNGSPR